MSVKKKTQVKKRRKPTRRERWDRTPYWLWIQFLQITYSQNPNVKKKYKDWIGFETLKTKKDFELWWGLYGDELFGDTTGDSQYVAEITSKAEIKNIKNDSYMYLEIPLNRKLSTSHKQVMDLIRTRRKELG